MYRRPSLVAALCATLAWQTAGCAAAADDPGGGGTTHDSSTHLDSGDSFVDETHPDSTPAIDSSTHDSVADGGKIDSSHADTSTTDTTTADTTIDDTTIDDSSTTTDSTTTDTPPSDGGCTPFTGTLATWDFTGQTGDEASVASASSASGVTTAPITRSSTLLPATGSSSINSKGWSMSSTNDGTTYYTFRLTPSAGCALRITNVALTARASATGASKGAVGTSVDAFTGVAFGPIPLTDTMFNVALSASGTTGGAIEVRVFGWGATSTGGTMRLTSTLTVTGSVH